MCAVTVIFCGPLCAQTRPSERYYDNNMTNETPSAATPDTKEYYHITIAMHDELELYLNELINLINVSLYRDEKLTIDEFIAQMLPVFKSAVAQTKYNVWTINRLLYLESFHEAWDQHNAKAYTVIIEHIEQSLAAIDDDLIELKAIPVKAPSMTEVPLLIKHYEKTKEILFKAKTTLAELLTTIPHAEDQDSKDAYTQTIL
jgi:hypothetical protein